MKNLSFFLFLIFSLALVGQSKKELERQRRIQLKKIKDTEYLLRETKNKSKATLTNIKTLEEIIISRKQLINNYDNEINILNSSIEINQDKINTLQIDIKKLKANYAKLVYTFYKKRVQYSTVLFIISANTINEAFRRYKFIKFFNKYRLNQLRNIEEAKNRLDQKNEELKQLISEKAMLKDSVAKETKNYEVDISDKNKFVEKLKTDEKKYKKQLENQKKQAKKLEKAIENIIKNEIAKNKKITRPNKSSTKSKESIALNKNTKSFSALKGQLDYPADGSFISEKYGTHPHPVYKNLTIENKGVVFRVPSNSKVKSIAEGEVSQVIDIPGSGIAIMVKHGEYFTVYTGLSQVNVTKGQIISVGESLGSAGRNEEKDQIEVGLQIWKGSERLNPETWLRK